MPIQGAYDVVDSREVASAAERMVDVKSLTLAVRIMEVCNQQKLDM